MSLGHLGSVGATWRAFHQMSCAGALVGRTLLWQRLYATCWAQQGARDEMRAVGREGEGE